MAGGSAAKPTPLKQWRIEAGARSTATTRSRPPQVVQSVTSTAKTRANKASQPKRRREGETVESPTDDVPGDTDIVVNATSIGLFPDVDARLAINSESLLPRMLVADIIINPPETNLLKDASQRGCTTLAGLGMLVNQGVISIKYWTGLDVDPTAMRSKIEEIFAG